MPIHDWTQVPAGIFHDFHLSWLDELKGTLNNGVLPSDHYALAEQIAGDFGPDVLTLQMLGSERKNGTNGEPRAATSPNGIRTVAIAPPKARTVAQTEMEEYALKKKTLVVRHSSGDRVVALIEVVSPGNKSSRHTLRTFVDKAASILARGYHLLVLDLHPPGARDPEGIHGAIWSEIADDSYHHPKDKPLTLASYSAGTTKTAYVEPVAVGDILPDRPLFLESESYVSVPLETTYLAAWNRVPRRWRDELEPR